MPTYDYRCPDCGLAYSLEIRAPEPIPEALNITHDCGECDPEISRIYDVDDVVLRPKPSSGLIRAWHNVVTTRFTRVWGMTFNLGFRPSKHTRNEEFQFKH